MSTAYYAVFHTLAQDCADRFIGTGPRRGSAAWTQVYRALEHGFAKGACDQARNLAFPPDIQAFADTFRRLQEERHRADYDPGARYARADVIVWITEAEQAIQALRGSANEDRKAFAALVLLKKRR